MISNIAVKVPRNIDMNIKECVLYLLGCCNSLPQHYRLRIVINGISVNKLVKIN